MKLSPLMVVSCLWLFGCPGPRTGPEKGQTYFWKVSTSDLKWGTCSDAADFRMSASPITISENSYFVYKVSADGKTAESQSCTALDVKTCTTPDPHVTFDIAGSELTFTQTNKAPITNSACQLQQTETWTLQDQGQTFTMGIDNVLSLVDSDTDCPKVEDNLKKRSPNMQGVSGCVVTYTLTGVFR